MVIADFLSIKDVALDTASDKLELLRSLSQRGAAATHISYASVLDAILKREKLGSTGVGSGVAIPHARINSLKRPWGALVRLKNPIDFEAIDAQPVDIVFFLLLPDATAGEQLNVLANVARRLREPQTLTAIRNAQSPDEIYRALI